MDMKIKADSRKTQARQGFCFFGKVTKTVLRSVLNNESLSWLLIGIRCDSSATNYNNFMIVAASVALW